MCNVQYNPPGPYSNLSKNDAFSGTEIECPSLSSQVTES